MFVNDMASKFRRPKILRAWAANALFKFMRSVKSLFPILVFISFITVVLLKSLNPAIATSNIDIPQLPRPEIRGVWITNNDFDTLKDRAKVQWAMTQLRQLNFNTIYPVIWNSGYVMYPSAVAQRAGIQPFVFQGSDGHDILADLINQAHRQRLLAIPWFEFGFMAPPTSELALNHPEWLTQKQDGSQTSNDAGGEVVWLNPFHPEVQQFITELVLEITTQYNADGIQFDDHMSLPSEFGYDEYTVALYTKETKKAPPKDFQNPAWVQWRANKITAFMSQLNQAVKAVKPNAIFSISPNYYDFAYKHHLQDWLAWVRLDIADELIVQVYRPNLESFVDKINRPEMQEAQQKIPTGVGIMTGLRNNPVPIQQIKSQVQAVQGYGLGVAFFYYESLWEYAPEPLAHRLSQFSAFFPSSAFRTALQIPRRAATFPPPAPPKPDPKAKPEQPIKNTAPSPSPTT